MMWWCSDLLETYWKPAAVGVKQSAPVHLVYFARISVDAAFRWDYTANGFTSLTDHMVSKWFPFLKTSVITNSKTHFLAKFGPISLNFSLFRQKLTKSGWMLQKFVRIDALYYATSERF